MNSLFRILLVVGALVALTACVKKTSMDRYDFCGLAERASKVSDPDWFFIMETYDKCLASPLSESDRALYLKKKNEAEQKASNRLSPLALKDGTAQEYYDRGKGLLDNEIYNVAARYFAKAIELAPDYADAYRMRGYTYFLLKKYGHALFDVDVAIKLDPSNYENYQYRGKILIELYRDKEAVTAFTNAIELSPDQATIYADRGSIYLLSKQYESALSDYDKAISLNKNDASYFKLRGIIKEDLKDTKGALRDYTRSIKLNSSDRDTYTYRAFLRLELKDNQGAIEDFSRCLDIVTNYLNYFNRGLGYWMNKQYREAIEDFSTSIWYKGNYARAYAYRASAYNQINEPVKARLDAAKARKLDRNITIPSH